MQEITIDELKMSLFNSIIECYKMEMKMAKLARLHEMESAYKSQMNDFLRFNFKILSCEKLYKIYSKHVLTCKILIELI